MDFDITRAKELIARREEIDAELVRLFDSARTPSRRSQQCSHCHEDGHTARTCPKKPPA